MSPPTSFRFYLPKHFREFVRCIQWNFETLCLTLGSVLVLPVKDNEWCLIINTDTTESVICTTQRFQQTYTRSAFSLLFTSITAIFYLSGFHKHKHRKVIREYFLYRSITKNYAMTIFSNIVLAYPTVWPKDLSHTFPANAFPHHSEEANYWT